MIAASPSLYLLAGLSKAGQKLSNEIRGLHRSVEAFTLLKCPKMTPAQTLELGILRERLAAMESCPVRAFSPLSLGTPLLAIIVTATAFSLVLIS